MERTAKIEILEGAAAGCHKCTVDGVVGIGIVAYRIPRALLQDGRARKKYEKACPKLTQYGVYFLFGKNKEGRKTVYIGQGTRRSTETERKTKKTTEENGVLFRAMQGHRTKRTPGIDEWDEVVMFVSLDEKTIPLRHYISSLEYQFYARARDTGNYVMRNGNKPPRGDHPVDVSTVVENANTMLIALGHYVLEPLPLDKGVEPPQTPNDRPETLGSFTLGDKEVGLLTGRHIVRFRYLEHEQDVSSWADMFKRVVKMLHQVNKSVLASLAEQDSVRWIHVRFSEGELRRAMKIDDRVYVEGNTSTKDKILQLRRLFDLYNIDRKSLVFHLAP